MNAIFSSRTSTEETEYLTAAPLSSYSYSTHLKDRLNDSRENST